MFHAHCWEVLAHLLGKEYIEKRPGQLVRAAKEYQRSKRLKYGTSIANHENPYFWQIYDPKKVMHTKNHETQKCDDFRSPWIVPEVQRAIESARRGMVKARNMNSYLTRLPLEIVLLVVEILCPSEYTRFDIENTQNMISAFALDLPRSYWKRRLQSYRPLFFELDLLTEADSDALDWQILVLKLMGLLKDKDGYICSGLQGRHRLLKPIQRIKRKLHEL
ncbi:hypothetical protein N7456_005645 [Penicillium angulare]|uniref:Uncharacterized protein n=1 Tax=Penicillium angulare TaxID=116970 RepID=A0A9W9FYV6_9EURO|nr:hypothetical protein N7456_005645 [Penicillium angulare]